MAGKWIWRSSRLIMAFTWHFCLIYSIPWCIPRRHETLGTAPSVIPKNGFKRVSYTTVTGIRRVVA